MPARSVLEDPEYRKGLVARAQRGGLPPHLEALLYHYGFGKPREYVDLHSAQPVYREAHHRRVEGGRGGREDLGPLPSARPQRAVAATTTSRGRSVESAK